MPDTFVLTTFQDKAAKVTVQRRHTLDSLAAMIDAERSPTKEASPLLKLAVFGDHRTERGSLRHDDNILEFTGIEVDYDREALSFEWAVNRVSTAGACAILYTSASYTREKPRWRALFPLATPIPAGSPKHETLVNIANGLFDGQSAPESWRPSQGYYFGRIDDREFHLEKLDGVPIDEVPGLCEEQVVKLNLGGLPKWLIADITRGDAKRFGGDRSALVWAVACGLARHEHSVAQIQAVLLNRDYKCTDHIFDQNDPVTYTRRQAEKAFAKAGDERRKTASLIEDLNREFAVVAIASKVAILREYVDEENLPAFALMGPENLRLWLANKPKIADASLANFWMEHSDRRQFEGIGFMPENARPGWYNLFSGFAVEPNAEGRCDLFLAHLRDNVACGNEGIYRWVVGWLADIVQNPGRKSGTALVLKGKMGVGKSIVGKTMQRLLGRHYVLANRPRYVTGHFNSHLLRCLLLHADEGFWAGDKEAEGVIKDLVTGYSQLIELKNYEPVPVRNYLRLLVTGNPAWLVPAGMEERRFCVLQVGEAHIQDKAYFGAIERQLDAGGYEALLHHLMNVDLSTVDIGTVPATPELLEQKLESLDQINRWWLTVLRDGELPGGCLEENSCPCQALYRDYLAHANMTRINKPRAIETQFGIALRRLMPLSRGEKPMLSRQRGRFRVEQDGNDIDGYVYVLPSLSACRRRFEELINQSIEWATPASDEVIDFANDMFAEEMPWAMRTLPKPTLLPTSPSATW